MSSSLPALNFASQLLDVFSNWTPCGERRRTLTLSAHTIIDVELLATGINVQQLEDGKRRQLAPLYDFDVIVAFARALESVRVHDTTRDFRAPLTSSRLLCRLTEYRPGEIFFLYEDRWDRHTTCFHSWTDAIENLPGKILSGYHDDVY